MRLSRLSSCLTGGGFLGLGASGTLKSIPTRAFVHDNEVHVQVTSYNAFVMSEIRSRPLKKLKHDQLPGIPSEPPPPARPGMELLAFEPVASLADVESSRSTLS